MLQSTENDTNSMDMKRRMQKPCIIVSSELEMKYRFYETYQVQKHIFATFYQLLFTYKM